MQFSSGYKRMSDLMLKREELGLEMPENDENELKQLIEKAEMDILQEAEVITTTCVAAFDRRLKNLKFR